MAFVKGQPRPANAGRKPGSKNKAIPLSVLEKLELHNYDALKKLLDAIDEIKKPENKCEYLLRLMEYMYSKKRPVEDVTEANSGLSREQQKAADQALLNQIESEENG